LHVKDMTRIDMGDLVFFEGATDDCDALDHVGMYFGVDDDGRYRFISSRKTPDGPTLGDRGGGVAPRRKRSLRHDLPSGAPALSVRRRPDSYPFKDAWPGGRPGCRRGRLSA
jgi:hypothetical protein